MKGSRLFALLAGLSCVALGCADPSFAPANTIPEYIAAAVADPARPESDTRRDANQKPAELMAFAGVEPGDRIADFWPVPPYSTRLLSKVAGPDGHVYAIAPEKLIVEVPEAEDDIKTRLIGYDNTTLLIQPFDGFEAPEPLDVVWMGKIYHDFPNREEMGPLDIAAVNRAVFRALKPGGVYIIVEHAAAPGSGYLDTEPDMSKRLHRIDPEIVKRQIAAAGFVLEAESSLLANPEDTRTQSVFDPSIRDRTDRFVFKFRKPL
jgi:predicted methyltransferase